ncbi:MAG: ABC transporter substrate-binding protein [Pseudomonadota bacterium]
MSFCRKRYVRFAKYFAVCLLVILCSNAFAEQDHMKVIYASVLDFLMDVPIAFEKGYFKKVGLDFEPIDVPSFPTRISMIPRSDVSGAFVPSSTALFLAEKGVDLVLVCGIGNRTFDYAVLKDSPIKSIDDFGGKKIANLKKPSNPWLALEYDLTQRGIKGYEVIQTGDDAERASMLLSGNVDITMSSPSMEAKLGDQIRVVHSCPTSKHLWNSCGWFFKRDFVEKHPETIRKFVQALGMAREVINRTPDEAVKIYAKYNNINQASNKKPFVLAQFDSPPVIYTYGLGESYKMMMKFNLLKKPIDVSKMVDGRFAKSLNDPY